MNFLYLLFRNFSSLKSVILRKLRKSSKTPPSPKHAQFRSLHVVISTAGAKEIHTPKARAQFVSKRYYDRSVNLASCRRSSSCSRSTFGRVCVKEDQEVVLLTSLIQTICVVPLFLASTGLVLGHHSLLFSRTRTMRKVSQELCSLQ